MAIFCDFENVALGVEDAEYSAFDIQKVLERLLLKGNVVVKKAYGDWDRCKKFKATMHEAAFELIEIPHPFCHVICLGPEQIRHAYCVASGGRAAASPIPYRHWHGAGTQD